LKKLLIAVLLAVSPTLSFAADQVSNGLTYNHIGLAYGVTDVDSDGASFKLKGYGIEASGLVTENIFLVGNLYNASTNKIKSGGTSFSLDIDFNSYELGLGYRMPISSGTDAYGIISGQNQKITATGANENNTYAAFAIGVKTLLADSLQLDANGGMLDGDFRGKLELQYKVTSTIGAVANYTTMKDASQYNFGIRYFY
jgi:hypothetical protein